MAAGSMADVYTDFCRQQQIETNAYVLDVLQNTTFTENVTLGLMGNKRGVQRLQDNEALALSKCLMNNQSVTGLDVRYNRITDAGVAHLCVLLQESNSLTSLDLSYNNIETNGALVLADCLRTNRCLLSLRLSGNKLGDAGATSLARMLLVNEVLRELHVADCDLAAAGFTALIAALKSNRSLRHVDVSRPLPLGHQEQWAVHVSDMLVANGVLLELHLGVMAMTNSGLEMMSDGLRLNHRLRYLDLRCNHVTRDGVRHLAQVLRDNPTLEVVDLSANRIEDEGAMCLSNALIWPRCSLRELSVCCNDIRTGGLLSLIGAVRGSRTLTHMYVRGNQLEGQVCQAFQELLASGRLQPEHTDVSPYEVDGAVFLADVGHSLRRHYEGGGDTDTHTSTSTTQIK